jgi:rhamnose transport system permease protein
MRWRLSQWELVLIVLTLCAAAWSAYLSPYYLSLDQIAYSTRHFVYPGILALGLAVVVILAEIDISLASTLAFAAVLFAQFSAVGAPIWVAVPIVVVACAALGVLNGFLVARLNLPSLAVTLGTMGAFRGLAFIIGSETGYTAFDGSYTFVGSSQLFGLLPVSFVLFLVLAVAIGLLMHRTVFGERCYAVGNNKEAAWIAGVDVARLKIQAFALAGGLAGIAGLVWIGQYGSARGDNADGSILFVVTAVVLGGIDINGGRGSILGVVLALFLLGTIRNGMGLANIPGPTQTVVLGALLIIGVLRPLLVRALTHGHRMLTAQGAQRTSE